jgi:hypothetical protein
MRIPAPTITFSPSRLPAMVLPLAFLLAELLPAQFGISLSPGFPVGHGGVIGQRPDPWAFVPTVQVDLDRDGQDELIATISWDSVRLRGLSNIPRRKSLSKVTSPDRQ